MVSVFECYIAEPSAVLCCIPTCRLRSSDYRERSVTAILYLNDTDWDMAPDADGGALKCYLHADSDDHSGSTASTVHHVVPSGGTLVLFDSRYLLHEVSPSNRDRYALTLWITGDVANTKV